MNQMCCRQIDAWMEILIAPEMSESESFDPSDETASLTFRIIMESSFEYVSTTEECRAFNHHLELSLREFVSRQGINPVRFLLSLFLREIREAKQAALALRDFGKKVLVAYRNNPNKSEQNTLIRLIESNEHFDDALQKILSFIVAGFDTTDYTLGNTLGNTLFQLAKHPDVVQKAQELLQGSLRQSEYLRNVVKESNRMLPVAAMGSVRVAERDFHFGDGAGFSFAKGQCCSCHRCLLTTKRIPSQIQNSFVPIAGRMRPRI